MVVRLSCAWQKHGKDFGGPNAHASDAIHEASKRMSSPTVSVGSWVCGHSAQRSASACLAFTKRTRSCLGIQTFLAWFWDLANRFLDWWLGSQARISQRHERSFRYTKFQCIKHIYLARIASTSWWKIRGMVATGKEKCAPKPRVEGFVLS